VSKQGCIPEPIFKLLTLILCVVLGDLTMGKDIEHIPVGIKA
jgi:hypothetical protein